MDGEEGRGRTKAWSWLCLMGRRAAWQVVRKGKEEVSSEEARAEALGTFLHLQGEWESQRFRKMLEVAGSGVRDVGSESHFPL